MAKKSLRALKSKLKHILQETTDSDLLARDDAVVRGSSNFLRNYYMRTKHRRPFVNRFYPNKTIVEVNRMLKLPLKVLREARFPPGLKVLL
ncbi:hypothetical protein L195_g056855 [Trifolium pratense]|uniref:Uncharacterized protein n=1 Tax=Trifolium pratense TaxID=57577 RepID=A0A2K3KTT6_TRIPR|nr:hypothetical protein L195_g056855 [Trifolium pratense]